LRVLTRCAVAQALEAEGTTELRTLVDLGARVQCAARVPDARRVFVNIGRVGSRRSPCGTLPPSLSRRTTAGWASTRSSRGRRPSPPPVHARRTGSAPSSSVTRRHAVAA
jgi:hypothetical protein